MTPPSHRGCRLYRCYDANDALLYVGLTSNPKQRFNSHEKGKSWWEDIVRIEVEHFDTRAACAAAERRAIKQESPLYNLILAGGSSDPSEVARLEAALGCAQSTLTAAHAERELLIHQAHSIGMTLRAIAQATGLSHQRIHQIVAKHGKP